MQVKGQLRVEGQDVAAKRRALGLLAAARDDDASDDASGGRPLDPLAALERQAHAAAAAATGTHGIPGDDDESSAGGGLELDPQRAAQLAALAASADPDALSLDALTLDEQRAFLRAVASGDTNVTAAAASEGGGAALSTDASASALASSWRPWWEARPEEHAAAAARAATGPLIQEVPSADAPASAPAAAAAAADPAAFVCLQHTAVAALPPPFKALSPSAPPSPLLPVLLVDVLYAYAHTQRLYARGDWGADALGAAGALLAVSQVLSADARPPSVAAALAGAMAAAVQPGVALTSAPAGAGGAGGGVAYAVAADVAAVLAGGPHYAADALAHARACVQAALAALGADEGSGSSGPSRPAPAEAKAAAMARRRLTAASRKLLYYLSWAHDPAHAGPLALALASTAAGVLGVVREHAALLAEGAVARRQQQAGSRAGAGIVMRG